MIFSTNINNWGGVEKGENKRVSMGANIFKISLPGSDAAGAVRTPSQPNVRCHQNSGPIPRPNNIP